MSAERCFYITTPIYYVNDRPHLGHAYTMVACDVLARFKRLDGYRVAFLTGTDEHGLKIEKSAKTAGVTPQAQADANSLHFREVAQLMNISNSDFIRTTEPRHKRAASALWEKMKEAGHIYLGSYAGWYSVRDEAYYQEAEVVNGKAPTGAEVEWVEEPSFFFNLSHWQEKLLAWYEENPTAIMPPSRRNEVISFVKGGLKDLSISRTTFSWGIPVPGEPKHIMYVWLDALTNYLSALGYPDIKTKDFVDFWPADLHVIGKDILRFHAVYWPAFLMAANLPLPKRIFAHGWWTMDGEKISKSLGNIVAPAELVERYGVDASRWFMLREFPFGNDGNFSHAAVVARTNSELANTIGNLAQRTLSMIAKNCEGKVPQCAALDDVLGNVLANESHAGFYTNAMEELRFHDATQVILTLANECNAFIDTQAPWKLKKEDTKRMEAVLYVLAEGIRRIALLLLPFTPAAANGMLDLLVVPESQRHFGALLQEGAMLKPGTVLPAPVGLFPRLMEQMA